MGPRPKERVGGEWSLDQHTILASLFDRRFNDFELFVPDISVFSCVRIEAQNREGGSLHGEITSQRCVDDADLLKELLFCDPPGHFFEGDMYCHEAHAHGVRHEHHGHLL